MPCTIHHDHHNASPYMVAINPEVSLHSSNSAIFLGYRAPRYCFLHRICLVKLWPKLVQHRDQFRLAQVFDGFPWFPNIKCVGWPFHLLRMFSVPFPHHPRPHGTWSPFVSPCAQESTGMSWLKNGVLKGSCQAPWRNVALPNCFHRESRRTHHPPICSFLTPTWADLECPPKVVYQLAWWIRR